MKGLLKLSRGIDAIVERLGAICNALVLLVIVVGLLNVVLRYLGKFTNTDIFGSLTKALTGEARPQNALTEAQWYIFSMLFFLGFAYILKHGVNVRVDILYTKWSLRAQAWVDFVGTVLFLVLGAIGYWRGRRNRQVKYFRFLLEALPVPTRETLIQMIYEEARAVTQKSGAVR